MEKRKIDVNQIVFILGKNTCVPLVIGVVVECVENWKDERDLYHIRNEEGKVYQVLYPTKDNECRFLTRSEYIELLKKAQQETKEKIKVLEAYDRGIEYQLDRAIKICDRYGHDYSEWKKDSWRDGFSINAVVTDEGVSYTIGNDVIGWSRKCKCCGRIARTTDKNVVDSCSNKTR